MNGNNYQYNPTKMFQDWIQKSGKAQEQFMKGFADMMMANNHSSPQNEFDPLKTLVDIAEKTAKTQSDFVTGMVDVQSKNLDKMMMSNIDQMMMSNFGSWGAYKTFIGTNGRISVPEAERDALGLEEGDLVQVIVHPITKKSKNNKKEVN
jgi:hypothetical protein